MLMSNRADLTLQSRNGQNGNSGPVVILGEVLWDIFPDSARLGGAPLNFGVHASRMGLRPILLSALGNDELGDRAFREIESLGLDVSMLRRSEKWSTGTAQVTVDGHGQPEFRIPRPAAFDDFSLTPAE